MKQLEWVYEGEEGWCSHSVLNDEGVSFNYWIEVQETGVFHLYNTSKELFNGTNLGMKTLYDAKAFCQYIEDEIIKSTSGE